MSDNIKHVHVRVPEDLYLKAAKKLEEDGKKWQPFLLSLIKKYVKKKKKK